MVYQFVAAAALLGAACAAPLAAAEYFVSPSGNDQADGTSLGHAFRTIGRAANSATAGTTVIVMPGTYAESVRLRTSGTATRPITFRSPQPGAAVLAALPEADNRPTGKYPFDLRGQRYIVLDGFTFRDCEGMVLLDDAHHNTIRNCVLDGSRQYFNIRINNGSYNAIRDCTFRRARPWGPDETGPAGRTWAPPRLADYIDMWRDSHHNLVEGCTFAEIGHVAVMIHGREPHLIASHNIVRNCSFTNPRWKCLGFHRTEYTLVENCRFEGLAADFVQFEAPNVIMRRNLFLGMRDSTNGEPSPDFRGVFRMQSTKDEYGCENLAQHNRIYHNLFYDNQRVLTSSTSARLPVSDNVFKNNIIFRNGETIALHFPDYSEGQTFRFVSNVLLGSAAGEPLIRLHTDNYTLQAAQQALPELYQGNLEIDPGLADPDGGHYRLAPGSPCIDHGADLTHAVGSGTGSLLIVADALYFTDGFGLIPGDVVVVGNNKPVRIAEVDYENRTLRLERAISWQDADPVNHPYRGAGPDIGPYEHGMD